jgi:Anaphase-promoting complex, cyclosome, subunit 3/PEGA domain
MVGKHCFRLVLVAATAIASTSWSLPALAEQGTSAATDSVTRAQALHRTGLDLLRAGDTKRALHFFERSRGVHPSRQNVTNIGVCLERLGRYDEALETYERLLTDYGDELDKTSRLALVPVLKELRGKVSELWVTANVMGTLVVDGRKRGEIPLRQSVRLLDGPHVVQVVAAGYFTFRTDVEMRRGERTVIEAELAPVVPAEAPSLRKTPVPSVPPADMAEPPSPPMPLQHYFAIGMTSLGGVLAGVAAGFGGAAAAKWGEAKDACPGLTNCPDDRGRTLSADARVLANVATASVILSAQAGVAATVLWVSPTGGSVEVATTGMALTMTATY